MSKRFRNAGKDLPRSPVPLREAVGLVPSRANAKFDETVELHVCLRTDPKAPDQSVRGTVALPHGAASVLRLAVFTSDPAKASAARDAGADVVGGSELIAQVRAQGKLEADLAVASPEIMKDLAAIARLLGPKGLMPNPKAGTIGADPAVLIREFKKGKTAFRADPGGNIHLAIGKASWDSARLEANARAALAAIREARPPSARGEFFRTVTLASTMGPAVKVQM